MRQATKLSDALIAAEGKLDGRQVQICAMEPRFIGGSMGAVVGEKITRAIERSIDRAHAAGDRFRFRRRAHAGRRRQPDADGQDLAPRSCGSTRPACLTSACSPIPPPAASPPAYAMLGDLNIAEPGALIGFAGPRVIEQTIRQKLPEGFQRSEFLLKHGMLDAVVPRLELKPYIARR